MDSEMFGQECPIFIGTLSLQDERLARGEAVFEGIAGRGFLSFGSFRTVRFGPLIRAVSDFSSEDMCSLLTQMYCLDLG